MTLPDTWGTAVPVLNAPMGGVAGGRLASAVSAAGGLGMVGMGSAGHPDALARELALLDADARFGIGVVDWVVRERPALWRTALDAGATVLAVSFGDTLDWVADAHAAGASAVTQVATAEEARRAQDAGIDVVVARGLEGGGHGAPEVPRDALLADVLDAVDVPVLAAGAIATGADVAHVLAAGAAGVWVGTAFTTCPESLSTPGQRAALLAANQDDTVLTDVFDIALGYAWPPRFPARVLRNDFWQRTAETGPDAAACAELRDAIAGDDVRLAPVDAGTGVGDLTAARPAADVVRDLASGTP